MPQNDVAAARLVVDILDYWLPGTGQSAGSHLDEKADRERHLPYLGGKHLKGLLRNAVQCSEIWGHVGKNTTARLFGQQDGDGPALLRVDNARLPEPVQTYCSSSPAALRALFREIAATAIDNNGAAKTRSLRRFEVVIPLRLEASVVRVGPADSSSNWFAELKQCVPLIRAVGKRRTRGFGRAALSLEPIVGPGADIEAEGRS